VAGVVGAVRGHVAGNTLRDRQQWLLARTLRLTGRISWWAVQREARAAQREALASGGGYTRVLLKELARERGGERATNGLGRGRRKVVVRQGR